MMNKSIDDFRSLFGNFPTGITVVGVTFENESRGITANSITSVSLEPMLLLVCIAKKASSHKILKDVGLFSVNFLAENQKAASQFFASSSDEQKNLMSDFKYTIGKNGSPILLDTIGWTECKVVDWFSGGDHSIVLGEVTNFSLESESLKPLVYYQGKYSELS